MIIPEHDKLVLSRLTEIMIEHADYVDNKKASQLAQLYQHLRAPLPKACYCVK